MPRPHRWLAAVGIMGFALMPTAEAQAASASDTLQQEINQVLDATEGGVQISRNEIAWNDGDVIMAFPMPGEATAPASSPAAQRLQAEVAGLPGTPAEEPTVGLAASDNCPTQVFGNDWYCFYQNRDFGGRRLQWNEKHDPTAVRFSDYGFANQTSSWSNKGAKTITVFDGCKSGFSPTLWTEAAHSRSSYVGNSKNDKADCFRAS